MAERPSALDVATPQVVIDFFDDPNDFLWHGRLLLVQLNEPGKWIVATPDLSVEMANLAAHRVITLRRNQRLPDAVTGQVYFFDPLTAAELDDLQSQARALATIYGVTVGVAVQQSDAMWVISDPGVARFDEVVSDEAMQVVGRHHVEYHLGIVNLGMDGTDDWFHVERVLPGDRELWRANKRCGPGRDPRLACVIRDGRGHRFADLRSVLDKMRDIPESDWPFRGPKAIIEVLASILAAGVAIPGYYDVYLRTSGIDPNSALAHELRCLLMLLYHAVVFDQLDAYNCASMEYLARRISQIQRAVRRSPKAPNFAGLELMLATSMDSAGGVVTSDYARFVAEEQKAEAFTLKQQRLYGDETTTAPTTGASASTTSAGTTGGYDGGGGGNRTKGKKGDKAGGDAGAAKK